MKKHETFYSGAFSVIKEVFNIHNYSTFLEETINEEKKLDRINALYFSINICRHPFLYEYLKKEKTKTEAVMFGNYRRLAGYAIWLRSEHVKQQCEIIKKINEV